MEVFFSDRIEDGRVILSEEESNHCTRVLRHKVGDEISVIDGEGTLYMCRLIRVGKESEAEITESVPSWHSHPYRLILGVCPTKNNDRFEWFVEKAVEIGVDEIVPLIGDRSERKVYKKERAERIALSAAKQSLKGAVPLIHDPQSVSSYIMAAPSDAVKMIAYCFDGNKISIKKALESTPEGSEIVVLIGPEGDFSPTEAASAISRGFIPVHLGDSRLRTETAAVTAAEAVYFNFMK